MLLSLLVGCGGEDSADDVTEPEAIEPAEPTGDSAEVEALRAQVDDLQQQHAAQQANAPTAQPTEGAEPVVPEAVGEPAPPPAPTPTQPTATRDDDDERPSSRRRNDGAERPGALLNQLVREGQRQLDGRRGDARDDEGDYDSGDDGDYEDDRPRRVPIPLLQP